MACQSRNHEVNKSGEVLLPLVHTFCLIAVAIYISCPQAAAQTTNAEPGIYSSAITSFITDNVFVDATLFVNATGGPYRPALDNGCRARLRRFSTRRPLRPATFKTGRTAILP
jgi:hypothetical protein